MSTTTEIVLRAALDAHWPYLKWRHHGIGALQAYLREYTEPEIRVHVWAPELVRPGIIGHGNAHDHRFDLTSTVLVGALDDTRYVVTPDDRGDWCVRTVEHARSAGASRNYDGHHGEPLFHCSVAKAERRISAGETYTVPRGEFHSSEPVTLSVTACIMANKTGTARLLVPRGEEPVHAFGEEFLGAGELERIVTAAREALALPTTETKS